MNWIPAQAHLYATHHYMLETRYLLCSQLASFDSPSVTMHSRTTGIEICVDVLLHLGESPPRVNF